MRWWQRVVMVALPVVAGMLVCCGLPLYWSHQQRMQDNPARVYRHYQSELHRYAERLQAGEVRYVEGRGYALPQFLIDQGARYVIKIDDCFVVVFGFMPTDAVPELWFSPNGLNPRPRTLERRAHGKGHFEWEQLSPNWGACYWDM
jgi:hypothetical protein